MSEKSFFVTTDKSKFNLEIIHTFLKNSYWAKDISFDIVKSSIQNSYCFGAFLNDNQIGFARVITDYNSLAYLLDVFIINEFQNKGFGRQLLDSIFNDRKLSKIKKWMLATNDAHALYKQYGFYILDNSSNKYMIRERS
ncbi:MAG: GNAT family N-acetyltransferase [Melioribacteraceae bacterium]|jgi:predicted acetyltransferase|nr:GNAT family N-acetyltransferase [Melioribacteraceae bacterium]